ncbi:hypothetical protein [Salipiger sp. PrR003]|uniref:hypothetical protein n=1 Tax=Salipiger sp. PrR003 TaxID=2706776 RepID=UPI0013DAE033|nr:hypothetical protein [Salipiger sp. PrR003]NDV50574.1 hypothetical protein [Salipiger sp. PrR003]
MSTSDLYIVNGKSLTHLAEFDNGWGSGPACWDHLSEKYLGDRDPLGGKRSEKLWDLFDEGRLQGHEMLALMMTRELSYIPLKNLKDAAEACDQFGQECQKEGEVNHWPAIAEQLRKAATMKHNRHARGVCLVCTSSGTDWEDDTEAFQKAWPIFKEDDDS